MKSGGNLVEILVAPVWSIEEIIGNLLTKSLIMIYSAGILTFVRHRLDKTAYAEEIDLIRA